ncbi:MAG: adenylate kinase [bacterium]|nr:adenylate kinase [bacterium]
MSAPIMIFLGTAGSGKGTQAQKLSENLDIIHLSTGDLLREARDNKTELGKAAESYIAAGDLVPDALILDLIKESLTDPKIREKGCILDGFPRTIAQAEGLSSLLEALSISLDKVFLFDISLEETIERLGGRRICATCHRIFHIKHNPATAESHPCDGNLKIRVDDTEEKIRYRYTVYQEQTAPLIDYYRSKLVTLDASEAPDKVYETIKGQIMALEE